MAVSLPPPRPSTVGLGERVVRALSLARDDGAAAEAVLGQVARALGAPLGTLWLLDERTGLLRWYRDWAADEGGEELRRVARRLTFAPGVGLPGTVFANVEPAWVEDVASDPAFPREELARAAGMRSALAAPLVSPDGPLGVIEFFAPVARVPAREELEAVSMGGRQLAAYLGRRRVEDRLRISEEASASIVSAALDCVITMDHRGRVVDFNPAAESTFGYERDEAIGELLADLIIPEELRAAHQRALAAYVEHRTPTILGRRLELVGMRADGSTFPVELTVTRLGTREPPVFAGFVRDITDRHAAEAELERLLQREREERARAEAAERATREVAEALQQSLLPPHLPSIAGLEIGAAYRGGTVGWHIGGDFYDVFAIAPDQWAIAIGDVCGKGPRAASVTANVRYALRYAAARESSPAAILETVSEQLLRDTQGEFCTAVLATVDVSGGVPRFCMAVAGHPLPLIARRDGRVEPVGSHGPLLGAFPSTQFEQVAFDLPAGELLVLYTDGVTEALTGEGRFGEPRLASMLSDTVDRHPQEVADLVDETVLAARVADGADDVAVLAVRAADARL